MGTDRLGVGFGRRLLRPRALRLWTVLARVQGRLSSRRHAVRRHCRRELRGLLRDCHRCGRIGEALRAAARGCCRRRYGSGGHVAGRRRDECRNSGPGRADRGGQHRSGFATAGRGNRPLGAAPAPRSCAGRCQCRPRRRDRGFRSRGALGPWTLAHRMGRVRRDRRCSDLVGGHVGAGQSCCPRGRRRSAASRCDQGRGERPKVLASAGRSDSVRCIEFGDVELRP